MSAEENKIFCDAQTRIPENGGHYRALGGIKRTFWVIGHRCDCEQGLLPMAAMRQLSLGACAEAVTTVRCSKRRRWRRAQAMNGDMLGLGWILVNRRG